MLQSPCVTLSHDIADSLSMICPIRRIRQITQNHRAVLTIPLF